jgi:flagellar hook-associated protein 3 FlgL
LTLEENALADAGVLLQRVRELTVQGNNSTVDHASRRMIAQEMRARLSELVDIGNRKDAGNEFLFSGYATLTKPFSQTGAATTYFGDQGGRTLQVSATQHVADSHSGHDVFMNITEGNGTFVVGATSTNTGSGIIGVGSVVDLTQWVADDYTLRFTSATGDYEIVDSAAAVVTTGVYTAGSTVSFRGINVDMTGMPASGDSFTIERSRTEDIFTTMTKLINTLDSPATQSEAQFHTEMGKALEQLEHTGDHMSSIRAQVGMRLSTLENAESAREDQQVELKRMTSELRDLDYAEAITRMNQQLVGLEAAQASYSRISQLSLFDYLR